ncbi:MAG: sulfite exporter TauE/SafE family protein [Myxococcales bacterium]|nr:sulfite exporter TauE/SafE family protein [Myxococcales bacterium]
MSAVVVAAFTAGLTGSLHCVAMCGPLVGLASSGRVGPSARLALTHGLGRLLTYVVIGALAGLLGGALDLAGRLASIQRVAALIAGAGIVVWGLMLMRGPRRAAAAGGTGFDRALVALGRRRPTARAFALGTLTGLVPCGWMWAMVVVAAGTGSLGLGLATMAAFWLGTSPAMLGAATVVGPLVGRLRARLPVITGATVMVLGLVTLYGRWHDAGAKVVAQPSCHSVGGARDHGGR